MRSESVVPLAVLVAVLAPASAACPQVAPQRVRCCRSLMPDSAIRLR